MYTSVQILKEPCCCWLKDSGGPNGPLRNSARSMWAIQASHNAGLRYYRKEVLPSCDRGADDSAIQRAHHAQAGRILPREIETANRRSGSQFAHQEAVRRGGDAIDLSMPVVHEMPRGERRRQLGVSDVANHGGRLPLEFGEQPRCKPLLQLTVLFSAPLPACFSPAVKRRIRKHRDGFDGALS